MLLRSRALLLCSFALATIVTFGSLAYMTYRDLLGLQDKLYHSYTLTDSAFRLREGNKATKEKSYLEEQKALISEDFRTKAIEDIIKSPTESNFLFVLKAEGEYRKYLSDAIKFSTNRMRYHAAISIGMSALLACCLLFFMLRFIFTPLSQLSTKMIDFLNNKYSYQFSVPENHEIGHLHATFNAMAQRVLHRIEDLKALDKAKSEFLSIASHELRTPLTSIKGSLSLLTSGVAGEVKPEAKNLMDIALTETDRLIRIINELLDLAKIEARQFPLQCKWISTQELAEKTLAGLKGFSAQAEVPLEHEVVPGIEVWMDVDRIQQVLTNLLSNAIKFSPKNKPVKLNVQINQDGHVLFEVIDQGRGIAPEDQDLIFEKFRQATNSQNPLVKGTGLGLAIAKALVEQHEGSINVRSRPGEGSVFYFNLPKYRMQKNISEAKAS